MTLYIMVNSLLFLLQYCTLGELCAIFQSTSSSFYRHFDGIAKILTLVKDSRKILG